MVGWHHRLNRHEFEQTPGNSGGHRNMLQSTRSQRAGHDLVTKQQQYSIVRVDHILFICSSFDGHTGCFQTLGHCEQCYCERSCQVFV